MKNWIICKISYLRQWVYRKVKEIKEAISWTYRAWNGVSNEIKRLELYFDLKQEQIGENLHIQVKMPRIWCFKIFPCFESKDCNGDLSTYYSQGFWLCIFTCYCWKLCLARIARSNKNRLRILDGCFW